jgi:hypothetical protein
MICRAKDPPTRLAGPLSSDANGLTVAQIVFGAAYRAFDLSFGLVHRAFGFELGVAGEFAGGLLDRAFALIGGSVDTILIHFNFLSGIWERHNNASEQKPFPALTNSPRQARKSLFFPRWGDNSTGALRRGKSVRRKNMYIGGGLVGTVVLILIVLFVLGRI